MKGVIIYAGDFNSTPKGAIYTMMLKGGFNFADCSRKELSG